MKQSPPTVTGSFGWYRHDKIPLQLATAPPLIGTDGNARSWVSDGQTAQLERLYSAQTALILQAPQWQIAPRDSTQGWPFNLSLRWLPLGAVWNTWRIDTEHSCSTSTTPTNWTLRMSSEMIVPSSSTQTTSTPSLVAGEWATLSVGRYASNVLCCWETQ